MDQSTLLRLSELLQKNNTIAIAVGKNPSVDDMAASLSLGLGLTKLGKTASIASPTQPLVEHSDLIGINTVKTHLASGGNDLVVSFPYREGEIEKVSYTIEGGFLNIIVKAGASGLQFAESDVRYTRGGEYPQLLFIVGTPRLSDLGSLFDPELLKNTTIVNIDNKTDNQGFGDLLCIVKLASSVSEIVAEILNFLGVEIDIDLAQNLLLGIMDGTDNFQSPKTTMLAFETTAMALKKGAKRPQFHPPLKGSEDQVSSFMPEQMVAKITPPAFQSHFQRPQVRPQVRAQQPFSPFGPQAQQSTQSAQRLPFRQVSPHITSVPRVAQVPLDSEQSQVPQMPQYQNQKQEALQQDQQFQQAKRKPPSDWLTPKVYRGSSNI